MKNKFFIWILLGAFSFSLLFARVPLFAAQTPLLEANFPPPQITGTAFALFDVQSDTFLLGENLDSPLSPASTTKVMTVLLALENLKMTDKITITREMFQTIPNDYVRLGLMEGEIITVKDAIYSSMLISANDCAMALALTISNSVEEFKVLMNERARQIGCSSLNFTNPYGYADSDHLCSVHDMALILAKALTYDEFLKVATTKNYSMNSTNLFENPRGMANGNKLLSHSQLGYEYFIGGKTGYTDLSGHTLVAGAKRDGRTLIAVIFGAKVSQTRYTDAISLFEYGFSQYESFNLTDKNFDEIGKTVLNEIEMAFPPENYTFELSPKTLDYEEEILVPKGLRVSDLNIFTKTLEIYPKSQTLEYPIFCKILDNSPKEIGSLKYSIKVSPVIKVPTKNSSNDALVIIITVFVILISIISYVAFLKAKRKKRRKKKVKIKVYRPN